MHSFLFFVLVFASLVTGTAAQATGGVIETLFFYLFLAMLVADVLVMAFDIVWSTRPRPIVRTVRRMRLRDHLEAEGWAARRTRLLKYRAVQGP
ncbi:MAG TPA: hypothetical protein VGP13_01670 [Candidatus Paceibacterota bacterium]|nr:hypothetical protein [Candidatus Paceibacterota bacterium]